MLSLGWQPVIGSSEARHASIRSLRADSARIPRRVLQCVRACVRLFPRLYRRLLDSEALMLLGFYGVGSMLRALPTQGPSPFSASTVPAKMRAR
jgi:hypothetical protein